MKFPGFRGRSDRHLSFGSGDPAAL